MIVHGKLKGNPDESKRCDALAGMAEGLKIWGGE